MNDEKIQRLDASRRILHIEYILASSSRTVPNTLNNLFIMVNNSIEIGTLVHMSKAIIRDRV